MAHSESCGVCGVTPLSPNYLWLVKRSDTRESRHTLSPSKDEAVAKLGWPHDVVLYAFPVKAPGEQMSDETKSELRARAAARREERRQLRANTPRHAGRTENGTMKIKIPIEQLKVRKNAAEDECLTDGCDVKKNGGPTRAFKFNRGNCYYHYDNLYWIVKSGDQKFPDGTPVTWAELERRGYAKPGRGGKAEPKPETVEAKAPAKTAARKTASEKQKKAARKKEYSVSCHKCDHRFRTTRETPVCPKCKSDDVVVANRRHAA